MKMFVAMAIILVVLAGIFHMLFIMFDYGFFNPDSGAFNLLRENLNNSLNDTLIKPQMQAHFNMYREAFGIGRIICIGFIPVAFIVQVIAGRKGDN